MRKLLNFIYYRSFVASLGLHVKVKLQFVVYFFMNMSMYVQYIRVACMRIANRRERNIFQLMVWAMVCAEEPLSRTFLSAWVPEPKFEGGSGSTQKKFFGKVLLQFLHFNRKTWWSTPHQGSIIVCTNFFYTHFTYIIFVHEIFCTVQ